MRRRVLLVALALLATGCFSRRAEQTVPTAKPAPRSVYVAVGASETVGVGAENPLRDAWPQVLFRTALPSNTVLYDLGQSGATVQDAIDRQLPEAIQLKPTVVTVWLNVNDIRALETPNSYEKSLRTLVHGLRRGGATRVYVADTPPLEALPAVSDRHLPAPVVRAVVGFYNDAIERVCKDEGATLVHLHDAGDKAIAGGTFASLVSGDGFHPSTAGHRAVAATFAQAIRAGQR